MRGDLCVLPDELWHKIFTSALPRIPTSPTGLPSRWYNQQEVIVPVTISHVCQLWRSISLKYPLLWSFIHIDLHRSFLSPRALDVWLGRSGSSPLTVICSGYLPETNFHDYPEVTQCLTKICGARKRWRDAWFLLDRGDLGSSELQHSEAENGVIGSNDWQATFSTAEETLPALRTFVLRAWITKEYLPYFAGTISAAPNLKQLEWRHLPQPFEPLTVHPSAGVWTSLESINLQDIDHRSAMEALSCSPSLERAHLQLKVHTLISLDNPPSLGPWHPNLLLSVLHTLNVSSTPQVASFIFDGLKTPSLRHFSFTPCSWEAHETGPTDALWESTSSMLLRSQCKLESIDLHNATIPLYSSDVIYLPLSPSTANLTEASLTHFRGMEARKLADWSKDSLQVFKYVPPPYTITVSSTGMPKPNTGTAGPLLLPQLREMHLGVLLLYDVDNEDSLEPLQSITAPSLSRLTISVVGRYLHAYPAAIPMDPWTLTDLSLRSTFTLTHFCLEIFDAPFFEEDFISFLSHTNIDANLQELHLTHDGYESEPDVLLPHGLMTERVIVLLSEEVGGRILNMRSLRTMLVSGDRIMHCGSRPGQLADMLRKRFLKGGLRLARVGFLMWSPYEDEHPDVPSILQLKEEGLNVEGLKIAFEERLGTRGRTVWEDYAEGNQR